ncbi:heparan-sulfate 6-O-sulfotransferase 3-B-like [Gadus macrocephalus]|uniref:heparan-sulfate 6-O-sulfotransferase 3-B-like n=1 Tax=Gadus macrocephalus TaxID=80720 RepID=UPI0028CB3EA4|nr:heparan-sulfate 6-O-sulfotransferase 3-B-like [Gadus macrocephalus]
MKHGDLAQTRNPAARLIGQASTESGGRDTSFRTGRRARATDGVGEEMRGDNRCQSIYVVFLSVCLPVCRRNFYYITMLRDPVSRYLSEWKHVQRGATWKTSLHMCDGRSPTQDELPTCYSGDDWSGVSLTDFMDCPSNLANNRQVRMLADLSLVGCYNLSSMNDSERSQILLTSAMSNLKNMAFYGLTEFQRKTQYLFERTFSLRFIAAFTQINSTRAANVDLSEPVRRRIEELNLLDMQLYEYAKDLFLQRFQFSRQREHREVRLKRREERRWLREQREQVRSSWLPRHPAQGSRGAGGGGGAGGAGGGGGGGGGGRLGTGKESAGDFPATTEDYTSQVVRW